jgi:hypothetical protein
MLLLPTGLAGDRGRGPWIAITLMAVILVVHALERLLLELPSGFGNLVAALVRHGRCQPADFQVHQLWTGVLVPPTTAGLLIALTAWPFLVLPLERTVGHGRFLLLLAGLAPAGPLAALVAGATTPPAGPILAAIAGGGALLAGRPGARLRTLVCIFLVKELRLQRWSLALWPAVAAVAAAELVRLAVGQSGTVSAGAGRELAAQGGAVVVAFLVGLAAGRLLVARWRPDRPAAGPLVALALGQGDLEQLVEQLVAASPVPPELLDRLADRCLAEQHLRAARALDAHLRGRPDAGAVRDRLRPLCGDPP